MAKRATKTTRAEDTAEAKATKPAKAAAAAEQFAKADAKNDPRGEMEADLAARRVVSGF